MIVSNIWSVGLFSVVLGTACLFVGCKKDSEGSSETGASATSAISADTSPVADVMKSYEECRALLADDSTKGIPVCANGIVTASEEATDTAHELTKLHLGVVKKAAGALAKAPVDDIKLVRVSFGSVSQAVVGMLESVPEAQKNYHLFECPMAQGYKRWVQPTDKISNPYMGKEMLACGSEVTQ